MTTHDHAQQLQQLMDELSARAPRDDREPLAAILARIEHALQDALTALRRRTGER